MKRRKTIEKLSDQFITCFYDSLLIQISSLLRQTFRGELEDKVYRNLGPKVIKEIGRDK